MGEWIDCLPSESGWAVAFAQSRGELVSVLDGT
jgi:hypothetical protein